MTVGKRHQLDLTGRTVFRKEENIVSRLILDETILVPIAGNLADMQCIFALEAVSAFIWEQIDGQRDLDALCSLILAEFAVEGECASSDLRDFLQELQSAGLIREVAN